jgi:hypothetical protein
MIDGVGYTKLPPLPVNGTPGGVLQALRHGSARPDPARWVVRSGF